MEVITICLIIAVLVFTIVAVRLSVNISCAEEDAEQYTDKQINTIRDDLRRLNLLLTAIIQDSTSPFFNPLGFPDVQHCMPISRSELSESEGCLVLIKPTTGNEYIIGKVMDSTHILVFAANYKLLDDYDYSYRPGDIYYVNSNKEGIYKLVDNPGVECI